MAHFTLQMVESLQDQIEQVLCDRFKRFQRAYDYALRTGSTSYVPHRLAFLHHRLELSKEMLTRTPKELDIVHFVEVDSVFGAINEVRVEPWWSGVEHELKEPGSFVHLYLLVLWFLTSKELGYGQLTILPASDKGRLADMRFTTHTGAHVPMELKTPEALRDPSIVLTQEHADKIVEKAYRKAAVGKGRQIGFSPSILCIGGLYLDNSNREMLTDACLRMLKRRKPRQIIGIRLLTCTQNVENPIYDDDGNIGAGPNTKWFPGITYRDIENPHYSGDVRIIRKVPAPAQPLTEYKTPK